MNHGKTQLCWAGAALAISVATALAFLGGLWMNNLPPIVRCGLLCLGLMVSAPVVVAILVQIWKEQKAAQHELELLCRADRSDNQPTTSGKISSRRRQWLEQIDRVREVLDRQQKRTEESEAMRNALEIRARRSQAEAERVNAILEALPEPVIVTNNYDELVLANPSAERLFKFNFELLEERGLADVLHSESLVQLLAETRRRRAPSQRSAELELPDETGRHRWYSVMIRTLALAEGEVGPGAMAVLRDISAQRESQKRNAEFVSAVSHEMKTPLAGIKAYVELLVDGDAEDEAAQEEFLSVINSQANRLQRLVDNLLNLARIEAGVVAVSKESRSLNELLEEAARICQPGAEAKNVQLNLFLSKMYLGVRVDRDMIMQAAMNLLSNAIKYTSEGGRVTLRSRLVDQHVQFEVEDTGVGLCPEDCQKVFEKFYRVQKNKDMATGTGLGLPLAKHIVEDVHGGKLTVDSKLGQGSTFTVSLPASAGQPALVEA